MSQPNQLPPARQGAWERAVPPLLFLIVVLVLWELAVRLWHVPLWLLPAPSQICLRFFKVPRLPLHIGYTLAEALGGFAASALLGVVFAALVVQFKLVERGVYPYVIVSNAVPIIAIVPLLNIWFGFGIVPKIMIAGIITFFPVVTNTARGLKAADQRVLDFMRSINASRWQVFSKVQFPSALPFIFAACKIAASLSLVGAVVAEFYGSDKGLGFLVITSATQLQTDLLFVAITILALLGIGLFAVFGWLERRVARWQPEEMQ